MANSYEMSGPHIQDLDSIEKTMWNVVLALIPAMLAAVYLFGTYALYLIFATVLACVVVELPYHRNKKGFNKILGDGSAVVTGVILGLSLPPTAPWWIPLIGGVVAIVIGKQLFGGLGNNIFNPALVGRAILAISWPVFMTQWVTPLDGVSTVTPLSSPAASASYWDLFIGNVPGSLGETSVIMLLIGAAYLYYKGYLDLRISLSYLISAGAVAIVLGTDPLFTILAGSLVFGAFFIATDMVSSPATRSGRIAYGIGCGVLTVVIREFTAYPEGVTFAVLIMNGFAHLFDTLLEGYKFGQIGLKKKRITQVGVVVLATVIFSLIAYGGTQITDTDFLQQHHRVFDEYKNSFFPQADSFNMLEDLHRDRLLAEVTHGHERLGFLAYVHRIGYSGSIENMIALDPEGEVIGSKIIEHEESSTLGAQIEKDEFRDQFIGLRYGDLNPTLEGGDFELDTITNATLSSIATAQTFESALELVNRQLEGNEYDYFDMPTGRYVGTGSGMWGEMEVEVIIEDGFLIDVNILRHKDTPHVARSAFERMKPRVISAQSTDVDTISGSTMSSRGMLSAIDDALAGERVDVAEARFDIEDGTYTGSASGMIGDIVVEVEILDGEVVDIKILEEEETTYLADPAFELLKERVLTEQSTEVDLVSGATMTSRGFLAAVADAVTVDEDFVIPVDDGTYEGVGAGYMGDIVLEVTVENGEIVSVDVLDHQETEDISLPAFDELEEEVIRAQTTSIDTVSGATGSSEGFLRAIENALGVDEEVEVSYEDGTYTATGTGYNDDIEIEVVVEDGEITSIEVLSHEETEDIAEPAFEDLEAAVLEAQSADVDTVSGATGSSEGYLEALQSVLDDIMVEEEPEEPEEPEIVYEDGTYTATGSGYMDELEVEVVIEEGEIVTIEVLSHDETENIANLAFEELEEAIISAQDADVDTVSGATGTSEGYLEAVGAILTEAQEEEAPAEEEPEEPEEPEEIDEEMEDGTYTATGAGYNDDIEIEVEVEDGEIVSIEVLSHEETEDIAEPAFEDLEAAVLEAQSADVDTVSGATGTSEGYLEALNNALNN